MRFRIFTSRNASLLAAVLLGCGSPAVAPKVKPKPVAKPEPPKITQFYAAYGVVTPGEEVTVCYGVENADTVSIEPNIKALRPNRNHCFTFSPKKTSVYKLRAVSAAGKATAQLAIKVVPPARPAAPEMQIITTFAASDTSVPKGSPVTLCYGISEADEVRIDPPVSQLSPTGHCFIVKVNKTTTYTLTATSGDRRESKALTITVE